MESPIDVLGRTAVGLLSSGAIGIGGPPRPLRPEGRLRRAVRLLRTRLRR